MPQLADLYRAQATDRRVSEHWSGPPEMVERIAATVATRPEHRVLDLGCGVGGPARRVAGLVGCEVVGIDLLPSVLSRAASRPPPGRGALRYAAGSVEALPLASRSVDQAWCLGVVAHVPRLAELASEVRRVLRPGGALVITEALWDGRRRPRFAASAPAPWRPVTRAALLSALRGAGLTEPEPLPWPGDVAGVRAEPCDPALAEDLADGRLFSSMVTARAPGAP